MSFAALPVALSATSSPPLVEPVPVTTRELLREVPTGLVVAVLFGFAQGTVYGAGSLDGALEGLSDREVALVLALPGVGCLLLTFPWGRWSDSVGRRPIMSITSSLATVAGVALVLAGAAPPPRTGAAEVGSGALGPVSRRRRRRSRPGDRHRHR